LLLLTVSFRSPYHQSFALVGSVPIGII
jgi:hypothetical protein